MKQLITLVIVILAGIGLVACNGETTLTSAPISTAQSVFVSESAVVEASDSADDPALTAVPVVVEYEADDLDTTTNSADVTAIRLNGDSATISGVGATVNGNIVTITSAGTFEISGTLNDGRIMVDTQDEETVVLLLSGVNISSSSSAPITISNAEKAVITLAEGSENYVSDASDYLYDDPAEEEPNAAIFSKDDLTINGAGSLTVEGNFNHGVVSKDDLKITGGTILVTAVNDGIKGRDSVAIRDGIVTVVSGGDGVQSNNDTDAEKGYVSVEGGTLDISAGLDGIQAETSLVVSGGDITLVTGGGSNANFNYGDSAKGLKAGVALTVSGGNITIDAADDAIHSNGDITINNGQIVLASGDDGVHAETTLEVNGGELTIVESYEGLEAKNIVINDGTIHLNSSDDGINGSSGSGSQAMGGGRQGQFMNADSQLTINGGYVSVDARGDGLDINGPITMTGGIVLVNGPVENNNGALDYTGAFDISGGYLVAAGSAGMAQAPSGSSNGQYSVMVNFDSSLAAGTIVHIQDQNGNSVLTFAPSKQFQSVVLSSPELEYGNTYTVYAGGTVTGVENDSLYTEGSYTPGTEVATFTVSSAVTMVGSSGGGFAGGGPGGQGGMRPQRP